MQKYGPYLTENELCRLHYKDKSLKLVEEFVPGNSGNYTKCARTVIRYNSRSTETQLLKYLVLSNSYVIVCCTLYYDSSKFTVFLLSAIYV